MKVTTCAGSPPVEPSDAKRSAKTTTTTPTKRSPSSLRRRGLARDDTTALTASPYRGDSRAGRWHGGSVRNMDVSTETILDTSRDQRPLEDIGPERYVNRELSWLDFASRLLDLAEDRTLPLMERVKFLAIFSGGIDEFFQVRVAGLKDQVAAGVRLRSPDGRTPLEQLHDVRDKVCELMAREDRIYLEGILPALGDEGIHVLGWNELDGDGREELLRVFERDIFPVLTPLAVDPGHPFPYISNLSLNLAVVVGDPIAREHRFARVKVPPLLPRFVPLADGRRFVPLEQLIAANLSLLFPDMSIGATHTFRVTRNADLSVDEGEADDLLLAVEVELRRRRFGRAVCLELDRDMPEHLRDLLTSELELGADDVYETSAPVDLGQLWELFRIDRPELHVRAVDSRHADQLDEPRRRGDRHVRRHPRT